MADRFLEQAKKVKAELAQRGLMVQVWCAAGHTEAMKASFQSYLTPDEYNRVQFFVF